MVISMKNRRVMLGNTEMEHYPSIDMVRFGTKLKEICEERNVSANDLKDYLNLSSIQAVYMWFRGQRLPNIDNLYAISRYLGVRMDDLINSEREENAAVIMQEESLSDHGKRVLFYWKRLPKDK